MLREFAGLYRQLTGAGVRVSLMQHAVSHGTPDACFPNNWFSTHAAREGGGPKSAGERSMVLYPMKCPNRAAERRPDVIGAIQALQGYDRVVDMTPAEKAAAPQFFEGTGEAGREAGGGRGAGQRSRGRGRGRLTSGACGGPGGARPGQGAARRRLGYAASVAVCLRQLPQPPTLKPQPPSHVCPS